MLGLVTAMGVSLASWVPGGPGEATMAPALAACPSFQALVSAAPSGGTITVPACVYRETVTISKPLTVNAHGATIDGENTRSLGLAITANDVTVNGLTVTRVSSETHKGAVWTTGVSRFTFRDGIARDSATICVSLNGGTGHRILDSELTGCGKEGYFANGVSDTLFARNRIHHNNMALRFDRMVEAGGGKVMASQRVTFEGNEVDHNRGPGIWFDNDVQNAIVRENRVHHNDREGIFFEISRGAQIHDNAVWENGWSFVAWGYGAGITISSSDGAEVRDNVVAWNGRGISVISQARQLQPHDHNVVHDNIVISSSADRVAGWYDDHGGTLFAAANGNRGYGGRYWIGAPEPSSYRFEWSGGRSTLGAYNGTPGEEGAVYLSRTQRDAVLGSWGIPLDDGSMLPDPSVASSRLAGGDRYATAAAISRAAFPSGAPVAYLATGLDFPDALAGTVAAARAGGPVLLVGRTTLPSATATELARLKPSKVVVLGGTAVVSEAVRTAAAAAAGGVASSRLAGGDRYATAAAISRAAFPSGAPVAYLATGLDFPDALAGTVAAARAGGPVLLVGRTTLPSATATELARLKPSKVVVLGGTAVVSEAVRTAAAAAAGGVASSRLAGGDRYATAAAISRAAFPSGAPVAYLATGLDFPDALAGTVAAARAGGPVLLVGRTTLPSATATELARLKPSKVVVLGGTAVVSEAVRTAAAAAAGG